MADPFWKVEVEQKGRQVIFVQAPTKKAAEEAGEELVEPAEWEWDEVDSWAEPLDAEPGETYWQGGGEGGWVTPENCRTEP